MGRLALERACGYESPVLVLDAVGPQGQNPAAPDFGSIDLADTTITQWELRDINGDGYPDLVFNTSAVGQLMRPNPAADRISLSTGGQFSETQVTRPFDLPPGTKSTRS